MVVAEGVAEDVDRALGGGGVERRIGLVHRVGVGRAAEAERACGVDRGEARAQREAHERGVVTRIGAAARTSAAEQAAVQAATRMRPYMPLAMCLPTGAVAQW